MTSDARVARIVALFAIPPAFLAGVIAGVAAGAVAGVVVFVVLAAALAWWARYSGQRAVMRGLGSLGARPADPVGHARLCNLVDGLSISAGLSRPDVVIVDTEGLNALAAEAGKGHGVLAVTSGLLRELELVELEAVIAEMLVQLRRGDTVPATTTVSTFGLGRSIASPANRDAIADLAGVTLTRYPPALAAALEKIEARGAQVPGSPPAMAHLWLADPRGQGTSGRIPLRDRIEALREL